jgi:myo-inositol catabolism protein IolC
VAHQLKKSSLVGVRFLPEEKEQLKELAAAQKKTLSELLRAIVLRQMERTHRKSVPEVNRKLYFELGQLSEKLQMSQISSEALNDLQGLLDQVRRELLGIDS